MLSELWTVEDAMFLDEDFNTYYEATIHTVVTTPRSLKSQPEFSGKLTNFR
mgnify:CR=1 FL=1